MNQKEKLKQFTAMYKPEKSVPPSRAENETDDLDYELMPNHTERFSHIVELGDVVTRDCDNPYGNGCCCYLTCPECKDTYMHQADVRVINRKEDCDGVATHIDGRNLVTQADVPAEEIVGRRDTIEIDYDCEHCGRHTLQLHQHKGNSLIKWIR